MIITLAVIYHVLSLKLVLSYYLVIPNEICLNQQNYHNKIFINNYITGIVLNVTKQNIMPLKLTNCLYPVEFISGNRTISFLCPTFRKAAVMQVAHP